jgi:CRISPR-associated protein Cmr2
MDYDKYLGLTIGPIIKTLSMARKPRELWSASYLFSGLMERLIVEIESKAIIISPGIVSKNTENHPKLKMTVGLYPDRLFCKDVKFDLKETVNKILFEYANEHQVYADYFKVYATEIDAKNDGEAVKELNKRLDCLELHNIALSDEAEKSVRNLIVENSLFNLKNHTIEIESLAEIASAQLEQIHSSEYKKLLKKAKDEEKNITGKDELIKSLAKSNDFPEFITPYKYICIVHADGDNVGAIVSTLQTGELTPFSNKLLKFGKSACSSIEKFQGFPVYAGGDDLLFIAPVVSNDEKGNLQTIFDLIKQIDKDFEEAEVPKTIGRDEETKKILTPSLSYGISITYYKYPLYEALEMSRNLLVKVAKELKKKDKSGKETAEKEKNAIAWTLQKGSGSFVSGVFSKNNKGLHSAFESLIGSINEKTDRNLVSAVAHKIKANEGLLKLFMGKENQSVRLDAFFDKVLEYNTKKEDEQSYLKAVKELLIALHPITNEIKETIKITYAMLRTAKFIKGLEDDKDE